VITRSQEVKGLFEQVQSRSEQNAIGIEQIAGTVAPVGPTTQQTAVGAEEGGSSGAQTTEQAREFPGRRTDAGNAGGSEGVAGKRRMKLH
jgi:methyl-accepting chemotaxis protein